MVHDATGEDVDQHVEQSCAKGDIFQPIHSCLWDSPDCMLDHVHLVTLMPKVVLGNKVWL